MDGDESRDEIDAYLRSLEEAELARLEDSLDDELAILRQEEALNRTLTP